ncbi:Acetyltransferase (GNAT) family protein [Variovorax sp. PBS-H4]|uniref:GNAT family N-acetyltransferase n=1 Tax=Variovorax sp. PBS-H4 TaxID=434008 RepID=UPI0013163B80|nr:GNAT family N-acetyltransferase [Variovorax sp. PBS-H4]VTU32417.1 Acetyltransferase (GNAT) family protein [Variovorax sp. PBS-H4]
MGYLVRRSTNALLLTQLQVECLPGDDPITVEDHDQWWVVWLDKQPVGFAALRPCQGHPTMGYLARAGVAPEHRGRGLQRRLIKVRENAGRRRGMAVMVTDTHLTNHASSNNLIRCGYRLYEPGGRWAFGDGLYWLKHL